MADTALDMLDAMHRDEAERALSIIKRLVRSRAGKKPLDVLAEIKVTVDRAMEEG